MCGGGGRERNFPTRRSHCTLPEFPAGAIENVGLRHSPEQHVVVVVPERLRFALGELVVRKREVRVHVSIHRVFIVLPILNEHGRREPPAEERRWRCRKVPLLAVRVIRLGDPRVIVVLPLEQKLIAIVHARNTPVHIAVDAQKSCRLHIVKPVAAILRFNGRPLSPHHAANRLHRNGVSDCRRGRPVHAPHAHVGVEVPAVPGSRELRVVLQPGGRPRVSLGAVVCEGAHAVEDQKNTVRTGRGG